MRRYLYGLQVWWEFFLKARRKKHGAGKQKLFHATKTAAAARYLVDGQFCNPPRYPKTRWLRKIRESA